MAVRLSISTNSLFDNTKPPRIDGAYCLYMLACRASTLNPGQFKAIYKDEATIAHINRLLERHQVPLLDESNMNNWLNDVIEILGRLPSSNDCQPMINLSILLSAASSETSEAHVAQIAG